VYPQHAGHTFIVKYTEESRQDSAIKRVYLESESDGHTNWGTDEHYEVVGK
jgi:hypothetical protein